MKLIICIIFTLVLFACSTKKEPTYTHGYIYDVKGSPLQGIKVEDPDNKSTFSISDDKGYFRINKITSRMYLYVTLEEKKIDSFYIVAIHPEAGQNFYFVEGRRDTLFVDMQQKKIR